MISIEGFQFSSLSSFSRIILIVILLFLCLSRRSFWTNLSISTFYPLFSPESTPQRSYDTKVIITKQYLRDIRDNITRTSMLFHPNSSRSCGNCPVFAYDWREYTQNHPILILLVEFRIGQFGNNMGFLLTNIACANRSGAHFIIINDDNKHNTTTLWKYFPQVIIHSNPAPNFSVVYHRMNHICNPGAAFPWDDGGNWVHPHELIHSFRPIMYNALQSQMKYFGYFDRYHSTLIIPSHLENGRPHGFLDTPDLRIVLKDHLSTIPKYPDVLIHYRCSDNIFFTNMGLTPFYAIVRHIPIHSKFIYIVTEKLSESSYASLCLPIVSELYQEIKQQFLNARVVLRQGGNILIIFDMIMHSKVVICSASTYCFYSATSNQDGIVYLPHRLFYNSYININNIQTMPNTSAIYRWYYNKKRYNESTLTSDIALKILRNQSYETYYPYIFHPSIHSGMDIFKSSGSERQSRRLSKNSDST